MKNFEATEDRLPDPVVGSGESGFCRASRRHVRRSRAAGPGPRISRGYEANPDANRDPKAAPIPGDSRSQGSGTALESILDHVVQRKVAENGEACPIIETWCDQPATGVGQLGPSSAMKRLAFNCATP